MYFVELLLFFSCFLYLQNSPVSTGTPVKFIAEEQNRLSASDLANLSSKISRFCTKAAKHNNHFRLVEGEIYKMQTSKDKTPVHL
jgi:hypothetical protein